MPIATHSPIGQELPYQPMRGNRHGLAEMATKRHRHEQQCKAVRRHPLSLVDNIKFYFINNTCHFNARLNYIINLYYVRRVRYFRGRCCRIGVMALSVMTQRRAIINDVLHRHLSPSRSCHTIPWPFQPPPPRTLVDCSVLKKWPKSPSKNEVTTTSAGPFSLNPSILRLIAMFSTLSTGRSV